MDGHTQGSCNIDFVGSAVKTYVCKQSALIFVLCYSYHGKYDSPWADRENSVGGEGGPESVLTISVFYRGPYGPPPRSDWTQGVQSLLEGGPYRYFYGNIQQREGGGYLSSTRSCCLFSTNLKMTVCLKNLNYHPYFSR